MGIDRKAVAAEAKRRSLADDGKSSKKERFGIRNAIRAEQGYNPEERTRGGVAGLYDRNKEYALPLALAAAPFALPAIGGLLGIGGGAAGAAAGAGAAGAGTAASSGILGTLGGLATKAKDFVLGDGGKNLMGIVGAVDAASQRRRSDDLTNKAMGLDTSRWNAGAPLRDAGRAGLLAGVPGNPFAQVSPMPNAIPAGLPPGGPMPPGMPAPVGQPPIPAGVPAGVPARPRNPLQNPFRLGGH